MRAGGKGVLGVYNLLENIIHYYYCQSEVGEDSSQGVEDSPPSPPLENALVIVIGFSPETVKFVPKVTFFRGSTVSPVLQVGYDRIKY